VSVASITMDAAEEVAGARSFAVSASERHARKGARPPIADRHRRARLRFEIAQTWLPVGLTKIAAVARC